MPRWLCVVEQFDSYALCARFGVCSLRWMICEYAVGCYPVEFVENGFSVHSSAHI